MVHIVKVDGEVFFISGEVLSTEFYQHVPLEGDMNYNGLKNALKAARGSSGELSMIGYIDIDHMEDTGSRELLSFGDYEILARQERMSPELRATFDAFLQKNPELRHRVAISPFASYPPQSRELRLTGDDGTLYIVRPRSTRGSYSVAVLYHGRPSDVTPPGASGE